MNAPHHLDPQDILSELQAIISSLIGGGKYGIKIRLPHAAVMTFLFRRETSVQEKLRIVLKSTFEHSRNLASFAAIYKTVLFSLKWISIRLNGHPELRKKALFNFGYSIVSLLVDGPYGRGRKLVQSPPGIPERAQHAAIAGALGGYFVWGRYSSINYQIVLYLTSRILVGTAKLAREKGIPPFHWKMCRFDKAYPFGAAAVWGLVMALFETYPHVLHPSLKRSMDEIYRHELGPRTRTSDTKDRGGLNARMRSIY